MLIWRLKWSLSSTVIASHSTDETDFIALSSISICKFVKLDFLLLIRTALSFSGFTIILLNLNQSMTFLREVFSLETKSGTHWDHTSKVFPWAKSFIEAASIKKNHFRKKWSFPLRISSVQGTRSARNSNMVTFTNEILNGKLHFFERGIYISRQVKEKDPKNRPLRYTRKNYIKDAIGIICFYTLFSISKVRKYWIVIRPYSMYTKAFYKSIKTGPTNGSFYWFLPSSNKQIWTFWVLYPFLQTDIIRN